MIQLLYIAIFSEMGLILTLVFRSPLRKFVIMGLDRVKRGRGPVVVKTVSATIIVLFFSNIYTIVNIQNRKMEAGALNPTDEILMAMNLLQASLLGFMIFLALMIDRLHHYIRELRLLRKAMEAAKKQNRGFEDGKNGEGKGLGEEVETLRSKVKWLESECEAKAKEAEAAEAKAEALRKQSEGSLLQYDHLLEDNQNLRNQLESIDQNLSQSGGKKTM
ncbi:B-CELL RECEPTOR-ASSOCIATED 31-LIKE PROTEIN-RELATED [Salix viminalis]|uniref:Endoplasmic reticulum transmembrane protein n=1 Tax=Salix viminalis TaxID=40686 RepID=A0A9Q0NRP3_SALVM|nr:B-CELL RECEPTOR-ASSOCIATED 31-LIKE PROTEIN-RELATED [Salix viminalis]